MLSRQLPTRPLPAAPVPVELQQTELRVHLMVFILNNYSNDFVSHPTASAIETRMNEIGNNPSIGEAKQASAKLG